MIVAAMQPYFFPYMGYFQLMAQCDQFVLLDDVQYVDRRWINRNRILLNGAPAWLTYPVANGPQTATIKERHYVGTAEAKSRVLNKVHEAYRRAARCDEVRNLVRGCLDCEASSVADVNIHLLLSIARLLGVNCEFVRSSDMAVDPSQRGQRRILSICKQLRATEYVNPIGGVDLYREEDFAVENIRLSFLKSHDLTYEQFETSFVPMLSVIDTLVFTNRVLQSDLLSRCRRISRFEAAGDFTP